jgi:hypothetical protein
LTGPKSTTRENWCADSTAFDSASPVVGSIGQVDYS